MTIVVIIFGAAHNVDIIMRESILMKEHFCSKASKSFSNVSYYAAS